jgi:hypothetical protein
MRLKNREGLIRKNSWPQENQAGIYIFCPKTIFPPPPLLEMIFSPLVTCRFFTSICTFLLLSSRFCLDVFDYLHSLFFFFILLFSTFFHIFSSPFHFSPQMTFAGFCSPSIGGGILQYVDPWNQVNMCMPTRIFDETVYCCFP